MRNAVYSEELLTNDFWYFRLGTYPLILFPMRFTIKFVFFRIKGVTIF